MTQFDRDRWDVLPDGSRRRKVRRLTSDDINATAGAIALAEELGIDLGTVEGTGLDGRITKPDVEAAAE